MCSGSMPWAYMDIWPVCQAPCFQRALADSSGKPQLAPARASYVCVPRPQNVRPPWVAWTGNGASRPGPLMLHRMENKNPEFWNA